MMNTNPEIVPGALVFLVDDKDRYGLHLRKTGPHKGLYKAPGGQVEGFETHRGCAVRESREELGIVIPSRNLYAAHFIDRKGNGKNGSGGFALRQEMCFV